MNTTEPTQVRQFDETTSRLLDVLQESIPLVERPFAAIGERVGLDETQVIERVAALKAKTGGVIRQISAIFDSRLLGYESCLVAAKIDPARLDAAAAEIGRHPGVSHNYQRNHAYNLWYTLAVPPDSTLGLERTLAILHRLSGATVTRLMPALRMFKIGVKFNLSEESEAPARQEEKATSRPDARPIITARDKEMIRLLQQDLPIVARPFDGWAEEAHTSIDDLLHSAGTYVVRGVMRRFSAVLRHRAAGFGANAMGAWIVPPEKQEEFGQAAAQFSAVSHCYLRPTYEDWPYSLFTMVHGKQASDCEAVLAAISRQTGISDYTALYSTKEYKKVRVRYFTPEIPAWEAAQSAG